MGWQRELTSSRVSLPRVARGFYLTAHSSYLMELGSQALPHLFFGYNHLRVLIIFLILSGREAEA